ncbi:MAG: 1-(5-phosphoribosyl)-5-[(5-phosphoribosylamino)methylideneamino]imidazole-4-carboxamide isomerase [Fusobacteriaceae bacterium]|jgi:phosphoribosylformimino-5-aminoimidazole carboxamide ribotide isomerase|nr:1-(5-phosphoribosyl)-5-[(5-phosphoribosylamino)methylideneamino]imidazole-4-carboxamide isomerase [Fusobacteriaceae bacterium]
MRIIPAIDLIGGKCVRLYQGDFDKVTEYGADPAAVALEFQGKGAKYLHLVDLDGARKGGPENAAVVRAILEKTNLEVELGGGIRTVETAKKWLDLGVSRVILGSVILEDISVLKALTDLYGGGRIIAGIDAIGGKIAIHGWKTVTDIRAAEFAETLKKAGATEIIYTDIAKDGALAGINADEIKTMLETGMRITASGGVSSLEDLRILAELGCAGAIIGKALYAGRIKLEEATALPFAADDEKPHKT